MQLATDGCLCYGLLLRGKDQELAEGHAHITYGGR